MAASVNKVILVGNLGKDPVCRPNGSGRLYANFSLATSERWNDKDTGEDRERTDWHQIVMSGRLAEIAQQYLHQGDSVYLEGSLRTRKYQDQDTGEDRFITEVRVESLQMLGSPQRRGQNDGQQGQPAQQQRPAPAAAPSGQQYQPQPQRAAPPAGYRGTAPRQQPSRTPTRAPAPAAATTGGGGGGFDDGIPFARQHYMAGG